MHAMRFLHTHLRKLCPTIHAKRFAVLLVAVETVTRAHRLTLTAVGRALRSAALVKHQIKRIDRLLGNRRLARERTQLYAALSQWVLTGVRQPIVVTDAGFRGTWFRLVEAQGWDWIGRVRNRTLVQQAGSKSWLPCKHWYAAATTQPTTLGEVHLVRSHPLRCTLHLVRHPAKGRRHTSVFGQPVRSSHSRKQAARAREPWLLASSPSLRGWSATRIMHLLSSTDAN